MEREKDNWLKNILKLHISTTTIILFSLIVVLLLVFARTTDIFYIKNWYPEEIIDNATVRWMSQDGVLLLHSYKDTYANISMNSFYKQGTLDIYLDNNFIDSFNIPQDQIFIPIHTGTNKLRFHAREGCSYSKNITDTRCLSFMLMNISTTNIDKLIHENKTLLYVKNWYPPEIDKKNQNFRWMNDNGTIYMFVEKQGIYNLNMTLFQVNKNTRVDILLNDQLLSNFSFNKEFLLIPSVYLTKGEHVLRFDFLHGCKIPPNAIRCLSVAIVNIGLNPFDDMLSQITVYKGGWYDFEKDEEGLFIWSNGSSEIEIFSSKDTFVKLGLTASSYHRNKKLDLLVNDNKITTLEVPTSSSNFVTPKIELKSGRNVIEFFDLSGCDIPFQIEDSDDKRCLSVRFRKIDIISGNR